MGFAFMHPDTRRSNVEISQDSYEPRFVSFVFRALL